MRNRAPLLVLTLLTLSLAGCGGSTSSDTGQTSQGPAGPGAGGSGTGGTSGAGGSTSAGGSTATGGKSSAGGASSVGGSSSAGGFATGGKSSAGGSASAGAPGAGGSSAVGGSPAGGSPSTGGAPAVGGSSSLGGSSSEGGSTSTGGAGGSPDWVSCKAPGDCLLEWNTCCGTCGVPAAKDYDAVDFTGVQEHLTEVCPGGMGSCPDCVQGTNPDLAAFCEMSTCHVVKVDEHPVSACASDADCGIRKAACCDCGVTAPGELVAINNDQTGVYEAQICGPGVGGCGADCIPQHPPGFGATCDKTGHCAVVPINSGPSCPSSVPAPMSPCSLPKDAVCEYGSDVRIGCRTHATCENGLWNIPLTGCPPTPKPGTGGCPDSPSTAPPSCPMSSDGLVCDFGGGDVCECLTCAFGACMPNNPGAWECSSTSAGCPQTANTGQPCSSEGQVCSYGFPCSTDGAGRTCTGGVWTDTPQPCPG